MLQNLKLKSTDTEILYQVQESKTHVRLSITLDHHELPRAIKTIERLKKERRFIAENNHKIQQLTTREVEVLRLIASGFGNKEIGVKLFVEVSTIASHRKNIIKKLGIKRSVDWFLYAQAFHHLLD